MVVISVNVRKVIAYFHGKTFVLIKMNVLKTQIFAIKHAKILTEAIGVHVLKDICRTGKQKNVFVSV